jgi:hypothetical protein
MRAHFIRRCVSPVAHDARVRPFTHVYGVRVPTQLSAASERNVAVGTFIRPFVRVASPCVHIQLALLRKSSPIALGAFEPACAQVCADVRGEFRRRSEGGLTRGTHVRAFVTVVYVAHVRAQVVNKCECACTLSAFVRSFVHVTVTVIASEVLFQVDFCSEVQCAH